MSRDNPSERELGGLERLQSLYKAGYTSKKPITLERVWNRAPCEEEWIVFHAYCVHRLGVYWNEEIALDAIPDVKEWTRWLVEKEFISQQPLLERPIILEIRTVEEARCLWHRLNMSTAYISETYKNMYRVTARDINPIGLWSRFTPQISDADRDKILRRGEEPKKGESEDERKGQD